MEKGYLSPVVEGGGQFECCNNKKMVILQRLGIPRTRTFEPPPGPYPQIFTILAFGDIDVFLASLRNRVVCLPSTFLHQLLTGAVGNVCLCHRGSLFPKSLGQGFDRIGGSRTVTWM